MVVKRKQTFLVNVVPEENMYHSSIAGITIDSVMRMDKKIHPQVYLEECEYKIKKIQMSRFINTELESDSKSDAELMTKLKFDYVNDSGYGSGHWL